MGRCKRLLAKYLERRLARLTDVIHCVFNMFCDIMEMCLKSGTIVVGVMHALLLNFSEEYKTWLVQSVHSLVVFLLVETEKIKGVWSADIGRPRELVFKYFTFMVFNAAEMIPVASYRCPRERKTRICSDICPWFMITCNTAVRWDVVLDERQMGN